MFYLINKSTYIGVDGAKHISDGIKVLKSINNLNLNFELTNLFYYLIIRSNSIGVEGALHLSDSLRVLTSINNYCII